MFVPFSFIQSRQNPSDDFYQFDSDGDIIRCGDNGRVGKRKRETLPFSPCQYLLLLTIYPGEKTGNQSDRGFRWKDLKLLVSKIACGLGWEG